MRKNLESSQIFQLKNNQLEYNQNFITEWNDFNAKVKKYDHFYLCTNCKLHTAITYSNPYPKLCQARSKLQVKN